MKATVKSIKCLPPELVEALKETGKEKTCQCMSKGNYELKEYSQLTRRQRKALSEILKELSSPTLAVPAVCKVCGELSIVFEVSPKEDLRPNCRRNIKRVIMRDLLSYGLLKPNETLYSEKTKAYILSNGNLFLPGIGVYPISRATELLKGFFSSKETWSYWTTESGQRLSELAQKVRELSAEKEDEFQEVFNKLPDGLVISAHVKNAFFQFKVKKPGVIFNGKEFSSLTEAIEEAARLAETFPSLVKKSLCLGQTSFYWISLDPRRLEKYSRFFLADG